MIILIDYDNVPRLDRGRGLSHLITRAVGALGQSAYRDKERVRCRLYGGWFQGSRMTTLAQRLSAEIASTFPFPLTISETAKAISVTVSAELALSTEADPKRPLLDTYRTLGAPSNLQCASAPVGCANTMKCALIAMQAFLSADQCPENGCRIAPKDVITRAEQKLVDGMLTVDMLRVAQQQLDRIAIVSSDDDLWPGIQNALLLGAEVRHVQTKAGRRTPAHYAANAGPNYHQANL